MKRLILTIIAVFLLSCSASAQMLVHGTGGGDEPSTDPTDQFAGNPLFSVGVTATALDNDGTITVASNIATFSVAFPTNVGVGDVVQYDVDNDSVIESGEWGIIRGISTDRTKAYLLKTNGGNVSDTVSATSTYDIFRAYTDRVEWEASRENENIAPAVRGEYGLTDLDLTDADDEDGPEYVALYADGVDSSVVTIHGRTTDEDHFVCLFAPDTPAMVGVSQRHNGKYDTTKQLIRTENTSGTIHSVQDLHVRFVGLQIANTGGQSAIDFVPSSSGASYVVDSCIIRGESGNGSDYGINISGATLRKTDVDIINSIIYGWNNQSGCTAVRARASTSDSIVNIYNCTISDNYSGLIRDVNDNGPSVVVTNSAIFNNTDDLTGAFTLSHCAMDDADSGTSMVDISPGTEATDWAAAFTDYANGDFSIKDSESVLDDAGTDLSSSGVTVDIIGTSRASHDIGAWELP